jgi:formate hydrogenlyase subunit 3/multisubunit Na+/H+ antiporter MnhD subunit
MLSGIVIQSVLYTAIKIGLSLGLPPHVLGTLLVVLAMLNMTLGNAMALVQTNTKRLLAYSSIAQTGYLMLGIGVGLKQGLPGAIQAGCLMLLAHTVMKAAAFLTKGICHFYTGTTDVAQLRGLARSQPLLGVCFSLALAGLAGVPPLAGFVAKWTTLTQSLQRANWLTHVAIVVFVLNGLVALGYYLTLIGTLFAQPAPDEIAASCPRPARLSAWMVVPLVVLVVLMIAIGVYPAPWLQWSASVGPYLLALGGE